VVDASIAGAVEEHQVEVLDLWLVGLIFEQPDVTARVLVAKPAHHQRQDHVGDTLEGADVDAAVAGLEPVDCHRHGLGARQQIAAVGQHHGAERGDPHGFRAAGPVEHGTADGLLQSRDLLTHRRLGVPKSRGRPPERALVGDRGHRGEMPQFDVGHRCTITSGLTIDVITNYRYSR
jgi:hypothetical protein